MKSKVTLWNNDVIIEEHEDQLETKVYGRCDSYVSFTDGGPNLNYEQAEMVERLVDHVMASKEQIQ